MLAASRHCLPRCGSPEFGLTHAPPTSQPSNCTGAASTLSKGAGIEPDVAAALVRGGLTTLDMLANDVDDVDIAGVLGIPVEEARVIRNKAVLATGGTVDAVTDVAEDEPSEAEVVEQSAE